VRGATELSCIPRAAAFAIIALLAACADPFPPPGGGGAAERAPAAGRAPAPAYWDGTAPHPALAAETTALMPGGAPDQSEAWLRARLETMSCVDFRLQGLGASGAGDLFPAEVALARRERDRALRELTGGLSFDGAATLGAYRDRVLRLEDALLRAGRPVPAEVRQLRC
jgi:hypothetical protein